MAVMEGSLSKWTNVMKGWQYRWFVLDENSGLLSYYTSKEKMMRGVRRGCVRLKGAVIGIDDEDDSTFTITVDHKTFHFQARDAEERENWVRALEDTIARHSSRMRWESNRPPPTIKDFDNKVSEADAYLQLMIEQTKKLEDRIRLQEDPERNQCQIILDQANTMLHNIKHSIVLLQIAKNTAHPVNGIYQPRSDSSGMHSVLGDDFSELMSGHTSVQQGVELGSECLERRLSRTLAVVTSAPTLIVPDMSYSSSEGEDDFFDANDSPFSNSQAATPTGVFSTSFNSEDINNTQPELVAAAVAIIPSRSPLTSKINRKDDGIDYDSLYNDDDEDEFSMESQGSVIKHLLSQVKIGMDLTKVVLPTFILERRSLLEMYADYFAHPDLFVRIAELKTPRERMIQVVKWYLSSYHAGRKSTVAKKPYNPVLGEVFRCHWNIPQANNSSSTLVKDGPVPWASTEQLTFVAEQVSHHPPISAFYAEHYNKRISFNAHIYTKSKFLGLSVCVYNIGEGIVSVLDYDEEYMVSFPNGYGRSILTIPWIELGGTVSIKCPKTGYYCDIEFLTKPFYGNRKHRVHAEIYSPEDKKSFVSITGEWNGVMEAKWADEEKPTMFIDVSTLSVTSKLVQPIVEQTENESRKVWMHVTKALKFNEIEKATSAKFKIEQRQREEAKDRKETRLEWQTKFFEKGNEDNWMYLKPLDTRILRNQHSF